MLGSFDFLGNPISLVSNLGTGVKDFFFQPIHAFTTNPKDIGAGFSKVGFLLFQRSYHRI